MKTLKSLIAAAVIFLATTNVFADGDNNANAHNLTINIPEVALLDLEGTTAVTLEPTAPTEAGEALSFATSTNNSIWVNYSSIVGASETRNVTAQITSGTVPAGVKLKVAAAADANQGKGTVGATAGTVTLSGAAQPVITGVKSCYTGNGASKGHNLTYSLELSSTDDYAQLVQGTTNLTITYTLTDN